jgi:SRSO17 transposase
LDTKIFVPEKWFDAAYAALRNACGLPEELHHQTKPEIALEILKNALARGELPCKWFFVEVRCTTQLWVEKPAVWVPPWQGRGRPACG